MNLKKERSVALQAAKQAGKVLVHYYNKKGHIHSIKQTPNKTFVADADLKANDIIIKTIKNVFPTHSILSEETGFENNNSDYKWVIDPLDGTHNFLHGIPIFGTSIALEHKNEVILGVLHFPILQITAVAEKGKGAFVNGKKIKVSNKKELDHSFITVELSYSNRKKKLKVIEELALKRVDFRNFGSAIYSLLLIASGKCDGYIILNTNEWDVAAGFLLVEEAGGKITAPKGKKWDFIQKQYILSNKKLHKVLLKYVKIVLAKDKN